MALIGHARVSTADQHLEIQTDQLRAVGCDRIFTDTASGAKADRPALAAALDYARSGDTLVVVKLDRAGPSVPHLVALAADLETRGIELRSLTEQIDTATSGGRLLFHLMAALAEFERDLIRERTYAGLAAARARGRVGGRKPVLTGKRLDAARALYATQTHTVTEIAKTLGVSRASVYRHLGAPAKP